jgi:succinate dehydrogenase flavin-adding protein (antitoxin of CptAB toxin-antitoxin module)
MELASNQQAKIHFSMERGIKIMNYVQGSFVRKRIGTAVKRAELAAWLHTSAEI